MNSAPPDWSLREESRLLYALLDAKDSMGCFVAPNAPDRWNRIKERIGATGDYDSDSRNMFELMSDLESAGSLRGSWIEMRWTAVKLRLNREATSSGLSK